MGERGLFCVGIRYSFISRPHSCGFLAVSRLRPDSLWDLLRVVMTVHYLNNVVCTYDSYNFFCYPLSIACVDRLSRTEREILVGRWMYWTLWKTSKTRTRGLNKVCEVSTCVLEQMYLVHGRTIDTLYTHTHTHASTLTHTCSYTIAYAYHIAGNFRGTKFSQMVPKMKICG